VWRHFAWWSGWQAIIFPTLKSTHKYSNPFHLNACERLGWIVYQINCRFIGFIQGCGVVWKKSDSWKFQKSDSSPPKRSDSAALSLMRLIIMRHLPRLRFNWIMFYLIINVQSIRNRNKHSNGIIFYPCYWGEEKWWLINKSPSIISHSLHCL